MHEASVLRHWEKFCLHFCCRKKNTFFSFTPKILLECKIFQNFLNDSQALTAPGIFPVKPCGRWAVHPGRDSVCCKTRISRCRAGGALLMVRGCERSKQKQARRAGAPRWASHRPAEPLEQTPCFQGSPPRDRHQATRCHSLTHILWKQ